MLPSPTAVARRWPGALARPVVSVAVLLAVYVLVLVLGDARGALGSDGGGKLATARVMADAGTTSPDVGYWAEDLDPEGRFHPLVNTERHGEQWVQATSVPYSEVTAGAWSVAGATGVALVSVAGAVAAALAARRLARRLGGDGTAAFFLVGLATPLAVYASDAWEHAPATGLALWGITLALDATSTGSAAGAGLCLGLAVQLRAEVAVYVLAFAVAGLLVAGVRRAWLGHPRRIAAAAAGLVLAAAANAALEHLVLDSNVRPSRAAAGAAGAGTDLGRRVVDALLTGAGLFPDDAGPALLLGLVLAAGLVVLARAARPASSVSATAARAAAVLLVGLYLLRLLDGLAFVPGLVAAAPVVALAVVAPRTDLVKVLVGTALGAVPLVWALQWNGNHIAQWGGRYLLLSAVLLTVVASVALARGPGWPAWLLVGLSGAVTLFGLAWHVERTGTVAGAGELVAALPADTVVVSTQQHLGRELGAWYPGHRWLSADEVTRDEALGLAAAAEPGHLAVIGDERPAVPDYVLVEHGTIPWFAHDLEVWLLARR